MTSATDPNASAADLAAPGVAKPGDAPSAKRADRVHFDQEQLGAWARDVEEALHKRLSYRPATPLEDNPVFLASLSCAIHCRTFDRAKVYRGDFLRDLIHYTPMPASDLADGMAAGLLYTTEDAPAWKPVLAKAQILGLLPLLGILTFHGWNYVARNGLPTLAGIAASLRDAAYWLASPFNFLHLAALIALAAAAVAAVERATRSDRAITSLEMAVVGARATLLNRLVFADQLKSLRWRAFAVSLTRVVLIVVAGAGVALGAGWAAHELSAKLYDSNAWPPVAWALLAGIAAFLGVVVAGSTLFSPGQQSLVDSFKALEELIERVREDAVVRERIVESAAAAPQPKEEADAG